MIKIKPDVLYAKDPQTGKFVPLLAVKGESTPADIVSLIYPVGSIYMSVNETNPEILFGGKWEQLKDRFLLGAGDNYAAGTLGGEATQIYNNGNILPGSSVTVVEATTGTDKWLGGTPWTQKYWSEGDYVITTRGNASQLNPSIEYEHPVNNMPPYLTVYMWRRIE